MEFFRNLLSSNGFMSHGYCYMWRPGLVWLHVVSDVLIALAYFSIPFTLIYFIRKRRDVPFNWIFVCFGLFIFLLVAPHMPWRSDSLACDLLAVGRRQDHHRLVFGPNSNSAYPAGSSGAGVAQP